MNRIRTKTSVQAIPPEALLPSTFAVTVITPGQANGYTYPAPVLQKAAPKFVGVSMFANHADALDRTRVGERRVEDLAGVLEQAYWEWEREAVCGQMRKIGPKGNLVAALARQIIADRARGLTVPNIGLSADMLITADQTNTVQEISRVLSLDVVFSPARGGAFDRVLNSTQPRLPLPLLPPTSEINTLENLTTLSSLKVLLLLRATEAAIRQHLRR
jgi:hypothetical protein